MRWQWALLVVMVTGCEEMRPVEQPVEPVDCTLAAIADESIIPLAPGVLTSEKLPPCDPELEEEEIGGACYMRVNRKAPCGDKLREYKGQCYRALGVPKGPRPNLSEPEWR